MQDLSSKPVPVNRECTMNACSKLARISKYEGAAAAAVDDDVVVVVVVVVVVLFFRRLLLLLASVGLFFVIPPTNMLSFENVMSVIAGTI